MSQAKSSQIDLTEDFIRSSRTTDLRPMHNKAIDSMEKILAEVVRDEKRQALERSSCISLSLDDKSPYRVLLFKSSGVRENEGSRSRQHEVRSGMLALLKPNGELLLSQASESVASAMSYFDEDYAVRVRDSILVAIKMFCTDLFGDFHEGLYTHILASVKMFAVDGALLKTGQLLKEVMPNLVLVYRCLLGKFW